MNCAVLGFSECALQAGRLAQELQIASSDVAVRHFPDGESLVSVSATPKTALLYRSLDDPNIKLVELLLAASALRDNGVDRVMLVAPYLAYMRQDAAFHPGEAVSQRVVGRLLTQYFDAVLTVDPHLHRTDSLAEVMPGIEAVSISAAPALAAEIDAATRPLIVGPDSESRQWVEAIAHDSELETLLGSKRRDGDREVDLHIAGVERAAGRSVVLVDDLISSGATMIAAVRALRHAGARRVEALVTHCLADAACLKELKQAGLDSLRATETVPGPIGSIPVAGLLADEIVRRGWIN